MSWFATGIIFAFLGAITMIINQRYRLDGHLISGMRGVGVGILFFPAVFFVEFPKSPLFWALVILEAFISTFYNARIYAAAAMYGAGSASRINVLSIAFGLVFWWILDYRQFLRLWANPVEFFGVLAALALVGWGFYLMHKSSSASRHGELAFMMPAVVVLAAMMINRKEIMEHAEFFSASVYYCTVAIFLSGVSNLVIFGVRNGFEGLKEKLCKIKVAEAGIFMALANSGTIFFGNMSSLYVPDPAYISALTLTTPIWVMAINKFFGIRDAVSPSAVLIMFLGLGALIYFA